MQIKCGNVGFGHGGFAELRSWTEGQWLSVNMMRISWRQFPILLNGRVHQWKQFDSTLGYRLL